MPKKTLDDIVENGNHYVIQVKKNQPKLLQAIKQLPHQQSHTDTHIVEEKKNGIKTTWQTYKYAYTNPLWKSVLTAVIVCKTLIKADNTVICTKRFYVSDKTDLMAKQLNEGIRGHWGIENNAHKPKDMQFNQDKNKTKEISAAVNRAILNTIAVNFLTYKFTETMAYSQILFAQNIKKYLDEIRN